MTKEKSKGFFSVLFTPKKTGCCNVQFEEISEKDKTSVEIENPDDKNEKEHKQKEDTNR